MKNNDHEFVWLGIFAHPDDETSASAGTMVRWIEEGGKVYIVTATGGEEGSLGTGGEVIQRKDLPKIRESELRENLRLYGANEPFLLRYRDQDLDKENVEEVSMKILDIMHIVEPDIVATFGPSGISNHPDHIAIHKAALLAHDWYIEPLQESQIPLLIYPTLPIEMALQYGLELSDDEKKIDIEVNIESSIGKKIQGLRNYKSQQDAQDFAERLAGSKDKKERFAVSPKIDSLWKDSALVSHLTSL